MLKTSIGTFLWYKHHFAHNTSVGAKANQDNICKYYKKYTQKLTQVEDTNCNTSDIYILYSLMKSITILLNTLCKGNSETIKIILHHTTGIKLMISFNFAENIRYFFHASEEYTHFKHEQFIL